MNAQYIFWIICLFSFGANSASGLYILEYKTQNPTYSFFLNPQDNTYYLKYATGTATFIQKGTDDFQKIYSEEQMQLNQLLPNELENEFQKINIVKKAPQIGSLQYSIAEKGPSGKVVEEQFEIEFKITRGSWLAFEKGEDIEAAFIDRDSNNQDTTDEKIIKKAAESIANQYKRNYGGRAYLSSIIVGQNDIQKEQVILNKKLIRVSASSMQVLAQFSMYIK